MTRQIGRWQEYPLHILSDFLSLPLFLNFFLSFIRLDAALKEHSFLVVILVIAWERKGGRILDIVVFSLFTSLTSASMIFLLFFSLPPSLSFSLAFWLPHTHFLSLFDLLHISLCLIFLLFYTFHSPYILFHFLVKIFLSLSLPVNLPRLD